ncbi:MBL fold metallo-hydrolase [Streptomyces sp. A0958]|uniref:MBL fold metallo-hydrolase n=1 Tax=Streptomyces sp. A0958 TaxID=2563101 RepID=UPI0014458CF0|nr:MBL fold metallo-hydrolase [Streptomyces sp. A0958]
MRGFDTGRRPDEVPGAPRTVLLPGHAPGSSGCFFPERGLLFTGDALVTHVLTGHTGRTLARGGFSHDGRTALASLDRLDGLTAATLLLPGHGRPLTGSPRTATRQARQTGRH